MSKKRQGSSSIVNIMDDENLDLNNIDDEEAMMAGNDRVNYMNVDISTDNIEDIITHKIENKTSLDDIYMINEEPQDYTCAKSDVLNCCPQARRLNLPV